MSEGASVAAAVQPRLCEALEQVRPELRSLADEALLPLNLDPLSAVALVRGALPRLLERRPRIVSEAPAFDLRNLDRLETYALALLQAHTVYLGTSCPPPRLIELSEQASAMRALLLSDVNALIYRGRISASRLAGLKRRKGHSNVASDVLVLAGILRGCWGSVENASAVTEADLDRAEDLGSELVGLIGMRKHTPEIIANAARERQGAYTLMLRAYAEVRRAIRFICRPDEDFDKIAPSLYRKRAVKRRTAVDRNGAAAEPSVATTAVVTTAVREAAPVPPGLPGTNPFMNYGEDQLH